MWWFWNREDFNDERSNVLYHRRSHKDMANALSLYWRMYVTINKLSVVSHIPNIMNRMEQLHLQMLSESSPSPPEEENVSKLIY